MLRISGLTVEYRGEGCVTDNPNPRINFYVESDVPGVEIRHAEVRVNGWSAGGDIRGAVYGGEPLRPFTRYNVEVSAEDTCGQRAQALTHFITGRLGEKWLANWITYPGFRLKDRHSSPPPMTFKKDFRFDKKVSRATIYATAFGIYELSLNGSKVGEQYFAPGFTSYSNFLQYQTYDVTGMIAEDNSLVAVVGGGWAVGSYTSSRTNAIYADRQALLLEMRVLFEDGEERVFGTDGSWGTTLGGNCRYGDFYDGEIYDATIDMSSVKFVKAAIETPRLSPSLMAEYGAPVKQMALLKPISCHRVGDELVYDFGQNFAGVICARIRGRSGQKITFRHAEILNDGKLCCTLLRSAKARVEYICREGEQTYSPRLTYMGFRYVGISGVEEGDIQLSAIVLSSDIEHTGSFSCSDSRINRLHENILWGARSNFMDIPTDCSQRDERLGWTGDIALFSPVACFQFSMERFLEKWLKDLAAEQRADGALPVVIPRPGEIYWFSHVAYWGDACVLVPWALYLKNGDKVQLNHAYPAMKRYLCGIKARLGRTFFNKGAVTIRPQYGDWCAPDSGYRGWMARGKWTATACFKNSCDIAAKVAKICGDTAGAGMFLQYSADAAKAYVNAFTDGCGKLKKSFQTAYVLPIHYGIFTGESKQNAVKNLAALVRNNNYRIGTGFPGTPYILFALADNGYAEDAFRMLTCEECPSWLYEVKAGATTIWERWDGLREDGTLAASDRDKNVMISFNHYASGSVGDFLYRRLAGIEAEEPGYKTFSVRPVTGGGITSAEASLICPYGKISAAWSVEGDRRSITVEVPVGATCHLKFFGIDKMLKSGKYTFDAPTGI